jgi:hypothetical protein
MLASAFRGPNFTPAQVARFMRGLPETASVKALIGVTATGMTQVKIRLDDGTIVNAQVSHGVWAYLDPQGRTRHFVIVSES